MDAGKYRTIDQAVKVAGPQREACSGQYRKAEAEAIEDGRTGGAAAAGAESATEEEAEEGV